MRRYSQNWEAGHLLMMFNNVRRRQGWFLENGTPRQFANLALAGTDFALKREIMHAWPVLVKIDISPLCNLGCTYCVHARGGGGSDESLQQQSFTSDQKMALDRYERLVHEIGGKSMAVSLYYLGDPLVHPDLPEMCGLAQGARLNSHVSTNFSFNLSDEKLHRLVTSGLTHLTVCVDAMHQDTYARTRVGGRLDVVLDNLDRTLRIRRELERTHPKIEVQFIKFQHNLEDLEDAARWCGDRGVDQFTDYWGHLHNYTDIAPGRYRVFGPKQNKALPRCSWPHFALQVKYNGDVIPCCYYRHGEQYRDSGGDARVVGNVLDSGLWSVWNSPTYQNLRRIVSNPQRVLTEPRLAAAFCDGCPTIFETDVSMHTRTADVHRWEDLYVLDERGRVMRRHEGETSSAASNKARVPKPDNGHAASPRARPASPDARDATSRR